MGTMFAAEALAIVLWFGAWWRLRGGAFTAMTGINPGTSGMRALAALAMVLPLVPLCGDWAVLVLAPGFWAGWSLAGWAAFQGMTGEPREPEAKNPIDVFLFDIRPPLSFLEIDMVGMDIEGLICLLPVSVTLFLAAMAVNLRGIDGAAWFMLAGLGFTPAYLLGSRYKIGFSLGRFAQPGTQWAEIYAGMMVGASLLAALRTIGLL